MTHLRLFWIQCPQFRLIIAQMESHTGNGQTATWRGRGIFLLPHPWQTQQTQSLDIQSTTTGSTITVIQRTRVPWARQIGSTSTLRCTTANPTQPSIWNTCSISLTQTLVVTLLKTVCLTWRRWSTLLMQARKHRISSKTKTWFTLKTSHLDKNGSIWLSCWASVTLLTQRRRLERGVLTWFGFGWRLHGTWLSLANQKVAAIKSVWLEL